VVPAPAAQGDGEGRRGQRGAQQHPVAAPGQAPAEPAERLVVELAHREGGEGLERLDRDLPARLVPDVLGQQPPHGGGRGRVEAAPRVGEKDGANEGRRGLAT
jgi:hypothetical protein